MGTLNDRELLSVAARTNLDTEDLTDIELIQLKSRWLNYPDDKKQFITHRRIIRKTLFGIIKKLRRGLEMTEEELVLKSIIDPQLDHNLQKTWVTFTFQWDVSPMEHCKVITVNEWFNEGGRIDEETGARWPAGFTEQAID